MENAPRRALVLHMRKAAGDLAAVVRTRHRAALVDIFTEEERIDFRRVPAQRNILIAIRKNLRLNEMTRR